MDPSTDVAEDNRLRTLIGNLLESESMSDVDFLVDQPPHRFPCHKLVLGLGSQVFKAMFYGKIREQDEIRVPDVSQEGFTIMLRYLYTSEIKIESEYEALETAYTAKKYIIKPLFKACEKYLLSNVVLDAETVFHIYEEASFLEMKKLQSRCLSYVSRNAKKLLHSESFNGASKATIQDILRLDLMDIESETEIIEAIWRWGVEQCKEMDMERSDENVRFLIKDFLQYVRFFSMKMEDLEPVLEKFKLLDTSEQLAVLLNLAMPKPSEAAKVPSNLCEIAQTRSVNNCSRIKLPTEYRYDGNLNSFHLDQHQTTVEVTVTGPPVIIIGAIIAFRPIPCYSSTHRSLSFELRIGNTTTNVKSSAKTEQKAEEDVEEQLERKVFLDEYVAISEGEKAELTVQVAAEGVRVMQCFNKTFSAQCGKARIAFDFDTNSSDKLLFPIKEIMCMSG